MAGKVKKVEILKNEARNWVRIFWHSCQFLVTELNFLGPETREYVFYRQINDTTFFLAYFLTLEYILEIFRAQFTNIFRKNARGAGKGHVFPPRFQYREVCSRRVTTCSGNDRHFTRPSRPVDFTKAWYMALTASPSVLRKPHKMCLFFSAPTQN